MKARIAGLERALLASVPLWAVLVSEGSAACTPATPTNGQTVTCSGTVPTGFSAPAGVTGLTVNTTADAVVGEQVTLTAANSQFSGIRVGASSTINNVGSIVTGSAATRDHYGVNLDGDLSVLNNSGSILVTIPTGTTTVRGYGVITSASVGSYNPTVNNSGTIAVIQNGAGIGRGIYAGEDIDSFTVNNTGLISATRTANAPTTTTAVVAGVDSDDDVDDFTINNFASGTIHGIGRAARGITGRAQEYEVNNSGRIEGGTGGPAILIYGAGTAELHNTATGVIVGDVRFTDTDGQSTTTVVVAANRRNSETTNAGRIEGSFQFGQGSHELTNTGTITGGLNFFDVADSVNRVSLGTGSKIGGDIVARGFGTNGIVLTGQGTLTSNVTGFTTLTVGAAAGGGGGGGDDDDDGPADTSAPDWILAAGSTQNFSGGTTIASGRLTVNGRLNGGVAVGADGTLAGIGTIGGNVANGGLVTPGNGDNPIGKLTVTGNYAQTASGTFGTTINADAKNSSLAVQNVASLNGQLAVTAQSGLYRPGTRYTLINATGGVTGAFTGVTATGLPTLLAPVASYDRNDAYLTLQQQSFTTIANTANQRVVGNALDRLLAGNPDALATLDNRSDTALRAALDRISGQAYTSIADPQMRAARAFSDQIMSRAYAATFEGGPSGFTLPPAVYAADLGKRQPAPEPRFVQTTRGYGVWATGYGQFGSVTNTANAPGRQETIAGIAAGVDMHPAPGTLIGLSAGYGNVDVSVNRTGERVRTDNGQVAIYGGLTNGALYANATVGYARADGRADRNLNLPGLQVDARASVGGNQFLSAGEVGYRWAFVPGRTVSPFAGYQVSTFQQERVREGNGLLALNVAQGDFTSARSLVGARVEAVSLAGERSYTIGVKVAYVHEFADVTRNIGAGFALLPAAPFVVGGRALDRDRVLVGAGIGTEFVAGLTGFVNYDAEVARTDMIQSVRGGMRYAF